MQLFALGNREGVGVDYPDLNNAFNVLMVIKVFFDLLKNKTNFSLWVKKTESRVRLNIEKWQID